MKRWYRTAGAEPVGDRFTVRLDGKSILTPLKQAFTVPTAALAEAVAAEWHNQGETVVPASMPLTRLANTAIDFVPTRRADVVDGIAAYAGSDLLCYRAGEPADLVERQNRCWQPLLDWAWQRFDARLAVVHGIMAVAQSEAALQALRRAIEAYDDWTLSGLQNAVGVAGSLVVGLALVEGKLDAAEAFAVSQLDETYQIEKWGEDAEAAERRDSLRADLEAGERFCRLLAVS